MLFRKRNLYPSSDARKGFFSDISNNNNNNNRCDHGKKIRSRKQRTDIGKYSFVNRTIQLWNQLPEDALGTLFCKPSSFRKRVRKVINKAK
jgi:hypothetical protein